MDFLDQIIMGRWKRVVGFDTNWTTKWISIMYWIRWNGTYTINVQIKFEEKKKTYTFNKLMYYVDSPSDLLMKFTNSWVMLYIYIS